MPDTSDELDRIITKFIFHVNNNPETSNYIGIEDDEAIKACKSALINWKNQELAGERSRHVLREGQLKQELAELKNAINVIISATQEDER